MKIRMLTSVISTEYPKLSCGTELDVIDSVASDWVASGIAEIVENSPFQTREKKVGRPKVIK